MENQLTTEQKNNNQKEIKLELQQDEEQFIVIPQLSQQQIKKMQEEHYIQKLNFYQSTKPYQLQNWYYLFDQKSSSQVITFKSYSFQLTQQQANLISTKLYYNQKILQEESKILYKLEQKVDIFLKKYFFKFQQQGCFMKLSTRSPKDYCWDFNDLKQAQILTQQLTLLLKNYKQNQNLNQSNIYNCVYSFILQKTREKIRIKTGKQFIKVFSKSYRIAQDLQQLIYLKNYKKKNIQKQNQNLQKSQVLINVWGRQWISYQWYQQFRCFYYNLKLTGISQYDQRCYFPILQTEGLSQKIKQTICKFFYEKVVKCILKANQKDIDFLKKGVIDIVLLKDFNKPGQQYLPKIVQINAFDQYNTRASLFNWKLQENNQKELLQGKFINWQQLSQEQLLKGKNIELRILNQSRVRKDDLATMMGAIDKGMSQILDKAFKNSGKQEFWFKK